MRFLINTVLSALIIAGVAELGKRSSFLGAILVSIPLSTVLALSFLYIETSDIQKVSSLSIAVFWLIIPSLGFLLLLPYLLKSGINFWVAMLVSLIALAAGYAGYAWTLKRIGIEI